MKKRINRLLSVVLTVVLMIGFLPVSSCIISLPIVSSAVDTSYHVGDQIELGYYPQTLVTDSTLIVKLNSVRSEWVSYEYYCGTGSIGNGRMQPSDYMRYKDVLLGEQKYRAVFFDTFRPFNTYAKTSTEFDSSFQHENGYVCNQIYWFKYEPITWRVLNPETGLILSDKILDSQPFNDYCVLFNEQYYGDAGKSYFAADYYHSSIRYWLNNDFYCTAFRSDSTLIQSTTLSNEAYTDSFYNSEDSNDKVFLLSFWDVKNTAYGFNNNSSGQTDYSKSARGTDYARIQGIDGDGDGTGDGYSWWRLRSAEDSLKVGKVGHDGGVGGKKATLTSGGIRPAMTVDLSKIGNNQAEKIESIQYLSSMPGLSENDAYNFLSFLYNKDFSQDDLSNDKYFQLLTGRLGESMSVGEVKGIIMAFSLILQKTLNEQISTASYQNSLFCDLLISNLEKELGDRNPVSEIVSEVSGPIIDALKGYIKDGLVDLCTSVISETVGFILTDEDITNAQNVLNGIKSFNSIPSKVQTFYNRVASVINGACFIYAQEKVGRYSYFSAYLQNRSTLEGVALSCANDSAFLIASDNTWFSSVINIFTWFTGKDSWQNHRDDIERWAEYCYQLSEYAKTSEHDYQMEVIEPSCAFSGYTHRWCSTCDYDETYDIVNPLGHNYITRTQTKATCTQKGCKIDVCSRCGDIKRTYTDALGHHVSDSRVVAPTCTQTGYTLMQCNCGYSWTTDETAAKGHSYIYTTIEPTEDKQGYVKGICSVCNDVLYRDFVAATGHVFVAQYTPASCDSEGFTEYTCSECGFTYRDNIIPKQEHQFVLFSSTPATCTQEGRNLFICRECEAEEVEAIDMLNHDYSYSVSRKDATCEVDGYVVSTCACGDERIENLPANGHSWALEASKEGTCASNGFKTFRCTICNQNYTEVVPMPYSDHNYICIEERQGQCTTIGYKLYECSHCQQSYFEQTSAFSDHQFGDWVLSASNEEFEIYQYTHICRVCGLSDTKTRKDDNPIIVMAEDTWIVPGAQTKITVLINGEEVQDLYQVGLSLHSNLGEVNDQGYYIAESEIGTATIACLCGDIVVATTTVYVVIPESIRFLNTCDQMYYGTKYILDIQGEYQDHLFKMNTNNLQIHLSDENAGQVNGLVLFICNEQLSISSVVISACVLNHPEIAAEYPVLLSEQTPLTIEEGVYVFHNVRNPAKVLNIEGDSTGKRSNIELFDELYNQPQKFRVVNKGNYYCIQSVYNGLWLDIRYPYDGLGSNIQLYDRNTSTEQKWLFKDAGNGNVYIRSLYGYYVGTSGQTDNNTNVETCSFDASASQQWRLVKTSPYPRFEVVDGVYTIHSAADATKVMDIQDNSMDNRANIQLNNDLNNDVQRFIFTKHTDEMTNFEYYSIQSVYSGLWIDTKRAAAGSTIQLFDENTRKDEKWILEDAGNGKVLIRSLYDTYIDVENHKTNSGANIQTSVFDMSPSMEWILHRVYTVSYDANGGVDAPDVQGKQENINLLLQTEQPIRRGYTFVGWNTNGDGSGTAYPRGSIYSGNADLILYAQWEKTPSTLGDADGDDEINLKDVVQITRYLAGGWDVTVDLAAADINKDGVVNLKDAVLLRRYLAGGWGVQLA